MKKAATIDKTASGPPAPRNRGALALAHQHLLGRIASGELPAGTAISELALAAELGISRTPVREALGQLIAEGMLQRTSRGAVVTQLTRQDIIDLYEVRQALEVHSIGKIAERPMSPRILGPLEALVEEMRLIAAELKKSDRPSLEGEALQQFINADMRFHLLLLQAGGNQRMLKIFDSTRLLLQIFSLRREHHTVRLLTEAHRYHRRIVDAVARGAKMEAMQSLSEHIQVSLEERLAEYEGPR